MDNLKVITYNLHGYNQGKAMLPSLCKSYDIILLQEHWLLPNEICKLDSVSCDFLSVATSAMTGAMSCGIRRGRPFGGVGFLIRKSILPYFRCIARKDRFIAICIGDLLLINVYLPCNTGSVEYVEELQCIISDLNSIIVDTGLSNVLIGGDFNFEFGSSYKCKGRDLFVHFINQLSIMPCDDLICSDGDEPLVTYVANSNMSSSFIDHFCASVDVRVML